MSFSIDRISSPSNLSAHKKTTGNSFYQSHVPREIADVRPKLALSVDRWLRSQKIQFFHIKLAERRIARVATNLPRNIN